MRPGVQATAAQQIAGFIAKYTPAMQKEARAARRTLRTRMPTAVEMIYDNYAGLVFGFAPNDRPSDAILSLVVLPDHVTICFLQGKGLDDPRRLLRGSGTRVRHIKLASAAELGAPAVRALIDQALTRARVPLPKRGRGPTVIRAVAVKQRPRRPR